MTQALRIFLISVLVSGVIYPLVATGIAKLFFSKSTNGSLIQVGDKTVGSQLIAQKFEKESYFWSRPSASNYDPMASGGSNLGPTSRKLITEVQNRAKGDNNIPSEMLYASGSGLDPDISVNTAFYQAERVAKARTMDLEKVKGLIQIHTKPNPFGLSFVNVLELNIALDNLAQPG